MLTTSVVIPCYNVDDYLNEALNSVRSQTQPVQEIILVDDGSRVPLQVPSSWDGPLIKLIRTENRGLAAARNTGIAASAGNFVAFLDADDHWAPRKLEMQHQAMQANPTASACYTRCVDAPGYFAFGPYPPADVSPNLFLLVLWYQAFFPPSSVLVRRSALDAAGSFREGMLNGEDVEIFFRLLRVGPFVQVPEPLTFYRQHPGQLTKNLHKKMLGMRQARRVMIEMHRERMIQAGLRPDKLWDAHRNEILLVYYRRNFAAARKLLWGYWREHPGDLGILSKAIVSLFPERVVARLRGRLPDRALSGTGGAPQELVNQQGWDRLVAGLGPVLRSERRSFTGVP